jgi:hypothetical protein
VPDPPAYGYYFVNEDHSIWASAWQTIDEENPFRAGEEGNKVGWFRPAGADLIITGRRLDAEAPPLQAEVGCCYPTRVQASGVNSYRGLLGSECAGRGPQAFIYRLGGAVNVIASALREAA